TAPDSKLRVLAAVSNDRYPDLPNVPTIFEAGYKGFHPAVRLWLFAHADTPSDIVNKISDDVNRILSRAETGEKLRELLGHTATPQPHAEAKADYAKNQEFWKTKISEQGIQPR